MLTPKNYIRKGDNVDQKKTIRRGDIVDQKKTIYKEGRQCWKKKTV